MITNQRSGNAAFFSVQDLIPLRHLKQQYQFYNFQFPLSMHYAAQDFQSL